MLQVPHNKRKLGKQQLLNPRPSILVGTFIDEKPNFMTVSWCGITSAEPPTMSIAIRNIRYSLKGIQHNMTFSVIDPLCFCTITNKSMGYYKIGDFIAKTGEI